MYAKGLIVHVWNCSL